MKNHRLLLSASLLSVATLASAQTVTFTTSDFSEFSYTYEGSTTAQVAQTATKDGVTIQLLPPRYEDGDMAVWSTAFNSSRGYYPIQYASSTGNSGAIIVTAESGNVAQIDVQTGNGTRSYNNSGSSVMTGDDGTALTYASVGGIPTHTWAGTAAPSVTVTNNSSMIYFYGAVVTLGEAGGSGSGSDDSGESLPTLEATLVTPAPGSSIAAMTQESPIVFQLNRAFTADESAEYGAGLYYTVEIVDWETVDGGATSDSPIVRSLDQINSGYDFTESLNADGTVTWANSYCLNWTFYEGYTYRLHWYIYSKKTYTSSNLLNEGTVDFYGSSVAPKYSEITSTEQFKVATGNEISVFSSSAPTLTVKYSAPVTIDQSVTGYFSYGTLTEVVPVANEDGTIYTFDLSGSTSTTYDAESGEYLTSGSFLQIAAKDADGNWVKGNVGFATNSNLEIYTCNSTSVPSLSVNLEPGVVEAVPATLTLSVDSFALSEINPVIYDAILSDGTTETPVSIALADGVATVTLPNGAITEAGTYTLSIPANYFAINAGYQAEFGFRTWYNTPAAEFTYTIEAPVNPGTGTQADPFLLYDGWQYTLPEFKSLYAYFPATEAGTFVFSKTGTSPQQTDADWNLDTSLAQSQFQNGGFTITQTVVPGQTYYIKVGFEMNGANCSFTFIPDGQEVVTPIEVTDANPTEGSKYDVSLNGGIVSLWFNKMPDANTIAANVVYGGQQYPVSVVVSNAYYIIARADIRSIIQDLLATGQAVGGESFQVVFSGIQDAENADNLYGEDGTYTLNLIMPAPQPKLVSEDISTSTFYSWWSADSEEGVYTFTFDRPIASVGTCYIEIGDRESETDHGYEEFVPVLSADGLTLTVDFRGVLRDLATMMPYATSPSYDVMSIKLGGVLGQNGEYLESADPGSVGSLTYNIPYVELNFEPLVEITVDGKLGEEGATAEFWISDAAAVNFDGVEIVDAEGNVIAEIPLSDLAITADPDDAQAEIITFALPAVSGLNNGDVVTLRLSNLTFNDGKVHEDLVPNFSTELTYDATTTGIETIAAARAAGAIYGINGMRLEQAKGLCLMNGEKRMLR